MFAHSQYARSILPRTFLLSDMALPHHLFPILSRPVQMFAFLPPYSPTLNMPHAILHEHSFCPIWPSPLPYSPTPSIRSNVQFALNAPPLHPLPLSSLSPTPSTRSNVRPSLDMLRSTPRTFLLLSDMLLPHHLFPVPSIRPNVRPAHQKTDARPMPNACSIRYISTAPGKRRSTHAGSFSCLQSKKARSPMNWIR